MHPEDQKSRSAGVLFLILGLLLTGWAWYSAINDGEYEAMAAAAGPTVVVLGCGLLIHGKGIPTSGATILTRVYGLAGSLASVVNLFLLGFFEPSPDRETIGIRVAVPVALFVVWFLPARVFGEPNEASPDTGSLPFRRSEEDR